LAKTKFYAIRLGVDPITKQPVRNLLLTSWDEAEKYVKGVKAEYKSFTNEEDAKAFLSSNAPLLNKSDGKYNPHALHVYVDGSFNEKIPNYAYGLVCVKDGEIVHMENGLGKNPNAIEMRQIGGELLGCMHGLLFAKRHGYTDVVVFHDYKGVCYHATGYWKRDNEFSETYYQWMQSFFQVNPQIHVSFCKVEAHSGDDFNELADGLAKKAAGLQPNPIFFKILKKYGIN